MWRNHHLKIFIISGVSLIFWGSLVSNWHVFPYSYLKSLKNKYKESSLASELKQKNTNFHKMLSCVINKHENSLADTSNANKLKYSFFVAGHTYGTPGTLTSGLYPKFYEDILEKS